MKELLFITKLTIIFQLEQKTVFRYDNWYGMYLNNITVGPKTHCFLFLLPELSRIHLKSDHQDYKCFVIFQFQHPFYFSMFLSSEFFILVSQYHEHGYFLVCFYSQILGEVFWKKQKTEERERKTERWPSYAWRTQAAWAKNTLKITHVRSTGTPR